MLFLILLLITLVASLVFQVWWLSAVSFVVALLALLSIWMDGGFQKCPKCGSHLTTQVSEMVPDASCGSSVMHQWTWQKCWHPACLKKTMLKGVEISQK